MKYYYGKLVNGHTFRTKEPVEFEKTGFLYELTTDGETNMVVTSDWIPIRINKRNIVYQEKSPR